jgi:uncharacterized protein HemX
MDTSTVVWIIIGALVVLAIIAVIAMMAKKKKQERNRVQATELREKAAEKATDVQRREALAKETEAKAAAARAEADRRAAEAQRLEAEAQQRQGVAAEHRAEHQEHLHRADELDPDVKHAAPTTAPPEQQTAAGSADSTSHDTATYDNTVEGPDTTRSDGSHRA